MKVRDLYRCLDCHDNVHYDPRNDRLRLQLNNIALTVTNGKGSSFKMTYRHQNEGFYGHDSFSLDGFITILDTFLNISKLQQLIKQDFPWLSCISHGEYFVSLGLIFCPEVEIRIWYLWHNQRFATMTGNNIYVTFTWETARAALAELVADVLQRHSKSRRELSSQEYLTTGDSDSLLDVVGRIVNQATELQ